MNQINQRSGKELNKTMKSPGEIKEEIKEMKTRNRTSCVNGYIVALEWVLG